MDDLVDTVSKELVGEAIEELTGRSSKKWVVILIAFIAGAAIAAYFIRRQKAGGSSSSDMVSDAADPMSAAISDTPS